MRDRVLWLLIIASLGGLVGLAFIVWKAYEKYRTKA